MLPSSEGLERRHLPPAHHSGLLSAYLMVALKYSEYEERLCWPAGQLCYGHCHGPWLLTAPSN